VTSAGLAERPGDDTAPLMTGPFTTWLGSAVVAGLGGGILYFTIGWTATGLGGQMAGLLLTLVVLPRTLLMLLGGAVGDRWGLRRTMIGCDAAMVVVLGCFLVLARSDLSTSVLLAGLAIAVGATSAFRMPAAGAFPRMFVRDEDVARALSLTGSVLQVTRIAGPPLGGVLVAVLGATGALSGTLVALLVTVMLLLAVRPPRERQQPEAHAGSVLSQVREGLAAARGVPGVVPLLTVLAMVAGALIPMLSLCLPLAARARHWGPGLTGTIEATWILGSLTVSLVVARAGTLAMPGRALAGGPVLAGLGVLAIAASRQPLPALGGALVMGVGTALFTSHASAVYVLRTPEGMLARFQALLGVVQSGAMLVANNVLGTVAGHLGATQAILLTGAVSMAAGVLALSSPQLRASTT
jgi:hypothetical protein